MPLSNRFNALLASLFLFGAGAQAAADSALPMWLLEGAQNRVYLLGSVHLLREQDYPLPAAIDAAYADAEALLMELDMDDLDPAAMQGLIARLGAASDGATLQSLLGGDLYAEASATAAALNIPLDMLNAFEPWLAAITIEQLMLQRIGFDPTFGVEARFVQRAVADGKEISGLEELAEQLAFLDNLSIEAQRELLIQTLDEAEEIGAMMDQLIAAWKRGDVAYLEANMLADMQQYPELYDAVVVRRNRNWVEDIEALLDDDEDYLVIVGALHLIGEDSVPSMLARRGHAANQLRTGN